VNFILPIINVIIPVFNAKNNLERCVESILYGSFRDLEVILIDDCSTDGSWELCQTLSEKYPNVIAKQNIENKGVSYTRNQGLKLLRSEFVLFVDSDDWVSGSYVQSLYNIVLQQPDCLPICGFQLVDQMTGRKENYVYNSDKKEGNISETEDLFELFSKIHIQQLWNKIFRKDIIEQYNIQFDEQQSMGEDFQFVLDYLKAAQVNKYVVLTKPLYYYVRANNSSLMSKFGIIETENEFNRLKALLDLSHKKDSENKEKYIKAVETVKHNHICRICRTANLKKKEKLILIEKELNDGCALSYYRKQRWQMLKEKLSSKKEELFNIPRRVYWKGIRYKNSRIIAKTSSLLKNKDFTIISQNCIGGVFYHDMNLQFKSPTINLFFKAEDYIKFISHLEHYLGQELQMHWEEEYPVGVLDDIRVYFMHYNSCTEAKESWKKRLLRIQKDNLIVIATDMEGFDDSCYEKWKQISYPKVLFSASKRDDANCVFFPVYRKRSSVPDLIPKREFYKDNILIKVINSGGVE